MENCIELKNNNTLIDIANELVRLLADYDPYECMDCEGCESVEDLANHLNDESARSVIVERLHEMYSEWHNDPEDTAQIASRADSLISAINSFFSKKE